MSIVGPKDKKFAILGMGSELNGDDAAGPVAARALQDVFGKATERLLIIAAGQAPEAFTGPLRRFAPDLVILIDAAELGETPGVYRWFDWSAAEGLSASTHTLPPSVLAQFLVHELNCRVMLVGIQPKYLDFDREMSAEVRQGVEKLVAEIQQLLQ